MGFADDLRIFAAKVQARNQAVFVNTCAAAKDSIQNGSPVTGAPGQPVDTSNLKASWQLTFDSPSSALISTNVVYAPFIEEGVAPVRSGNVTGTTKQRLTLRSPVGGFHSVALTVAGLSRIVETETAKLTGGANA